MGGCIEGANANHKDRLRFVSVKHQIHEAQRQGFTEDETASSVIRSMYSGLRHKSILVMKSNLALATLIGYLQQHYEEKSSTDLCAQLTSLNQMPNEGVVDFILRCIELREKLTLTSKRSGEIEYDEVLVSCLFLRSAEIRLESSLILQEIRPVLRSEGVTDEDTLSATQRATAGEREKTKNFSKDPVK